MTEQSPKSRKSFAPQNQPEERWGLLMPAAIVVALLLIGGMLFVRMTGG